MDTSKIYELVTVFSSKAEPESIDEFKKQLTGVGFEVESEDKMGAKKLAYPMKKMEKGNFVVWQLKAVKSIDYKALNLSINRNNNIIRYLLIKK